LLYSNSEVVKLESLKSYDFYFGKIHLHPTRGEFQRGLTQARAKVTSFPRGVLEWLFITVAVLVVTGGSKAPHPLFW